MKTHYLERRHSLFVGYVGKVINISDIDFKIHSQLLYNYSEKNSSITAPVKRERCEAQNGDSPHSRRMLLKERAFYVALSPLLSVTCLHMKQSFQRAPSTTKEMNNGRCPHVCKYDVISSLVHTYLLRTNKAVHASIEAH